MRRGESGIENEGGRITFGGWEVGRIVDLGGGATAIKRRKYVGGSKVAARSANTEQAPSKDVALGSGLIPEERSQFRRMQRLLGPANNL